MLVNLEHSAVAAGLENISFHFNPKEKQWQRMYNYWSIAFISHASKVVLEILPARLQPYVNRELQDVQAGCIKGRRARYQIANICLIIKKQGSYIKNK